MPGTAVFLTRQDEDVPALLKWHLVQNKALHDDLIVLTVRNAPVPWTDADKRLEVKELAQHYWRAKVTFGFMERPDIPAAIERMRDHGCGGNLKDFSYYVGHTSVTHRDDDQALPRWQEAIYAMMERNSQHGGDVLRLPQDRTVELGRQIAI